MSGGANSALAQLCAAENRALIPRSWAHRGGRTPCWPWCWSSAAASWRMGGEVTR